MLEWLLEGDPVIQYKVYRDLLHDESKLKDLQNLMLKEGWVKAYLSERNEHGHWGNKFYHPKWTCSHYTLMDLCLFNAPTTPEIMATIHKIAEENKSPDGGVNPHTELQKSDVCINGMFLDYACYFGIEEEKLHSVVDFVISQAMTDGGFNCRLNRSGAKHSSVHTTIAMLEGIERYKSQGYTYRLKELLKLQSSSEEFLLNHHLFKSDKTGEVIHKSFTVFTYPWRWKYNVLRAMYYFANADRPYDKRMDDALELIEAKSKKGKWPVRSKHPGQVHLVLEPSRTMSRMSTIMALFVLSKYKKSQQWLANVLEL